MCHGGHEGHEGHAGHNVLYFLNAAGSRISNMTFDFILNQNKKPIACGWSLVFSFGWKRNPLLSNLCFQLVPRDATAWRSLSQSNSLENWDFPHFPPPAPTHPSPLQMGRRGSLIVISAPARPEAARTLPCYFFHGVLLEGKESTQLQAGQQKPNSLTLSGRLRKYNW